jgi:hypothetical protein
MKSRVFAFLTAALALGLAGPVSLSAQAVTTATLGGQVVDQNGRPVASAQVQIVNEATGLQRGTLTRPDGQFLFPGLRPGGPYTVTVSSVGYAEQVQEGIQLGLGQTERISIRLTEEAVEIEGLEVAVAGRAARNTGVQTVVSQEQVERAPTINREIVDIARLTPSAFVANEDDDGAAISIAGQNNEYNALYIDGVVNNDVFGLSAQGTNGGQTGAPPISFDAIEQLQIAVSPYDVTQGGFTGGAINAITRSGTNRFEGSFYYQLRNEGLAGESVWLESPSALPEFSAERYGFRFGGPIVEDKLFFFLNGELFRSETPAPFDLQSYRGERGIDTFEQIRSVVQNELGYDAGDFGDKISSLDDDKVFAKIDWNISDNHRLSLRHSYSQSDNVDAFASRGFNINYSNTSEVFPNETNSSALELNSSFGDRFSNQFLMGLTFVRDDRGFAGDPFPYVVIEDGDADIQLGSEQFSTGNILNQDILSITNNFKIFAGDHTITIGTHNEFYDIGNLFLRQNFGSYEYGSVEEFLQSVRAVNDPSIEPAFPREFQRGFSLVDDVAGDASNAIGAFEAFQLGFYVQDEWQPSDRLRLTAGLRVDIPKLSTNPRSAPDANSSTLPQLAEFYDLQGAQAGETPDAAPYIAPRIGVNYDLAEDGSTRLRGGLGVFTGRVPFVYPGAMYLNNGVTAGFIDEPVLPGGQPVPFIPNPDNQLTADDFGRSVVPSGELDIFASDFRYPRVFRMSGGVDHLLPGGYLLTVEGQYTKNMDNILVRNVNLRPQNDNLDGPDNRPVYNYGLNRFGGLEHEYIDQRYGAILLVENTADGYTWDATAQLSKTWDNGISASFAYSYGDAYSVNDATSDQIWSVWRFEENVNGLNNLEQARSQFSLGHRLLGQFSYRREFFGNLGTSISAIYSGEDGRTFSWVIGGFTNDLTGEPSGSNPLAYIPESGSELLWEDPADAAAFDAFVDSNEYLSSRRGQYTERNADRAPLEHIIDLRIAQEVFANIGGRRNTVELTLDIFNFTNLLNDDWGRRYSVGFNTIPLVRFEGFRDAEAGDLTPIYSFDFDEANLDEFWDDQVLDFGNYGSRWLMQFGVRYTF